MPTPYLVPSLVLLRSTLNARFPHRDKTSDGWIGDQAHQARSSQHNPDAEGRVHAIDVDKDLREPGTTLQNVLDRIIIQQRAGDGRLQNIIHNERIWSRSWGWTPRAYGGDNPHHEHAHIECRQIDPARNSMKPWPMPPHNTPEEDVNVNDLLDADAIPNDINPGKPGEPGYNANMTVEWALRYASRAELARKAAESTLAGVSTLLARPAATVVLSPDQLDAVVSRVSAAVLDQLAARLEK